jgi:hypothetical protein
VSAAQLAAGADKPPFVAPAEAPGAAHLSRRHAHAGAFSSRGKRRAALPQPREGGLRLSVRVVRRSWLCTRRCRRECLHLRHHGCRCVAPIAARDASRAASISQFTYRSRMSSMRYVPRATRAAGGARWSDRDAPGRQYARQVGESFRNSGTPRSVVNQSARVSYAGLEARA